MLTVVPIRRPLVRLASGQPPSPLSHAAAGNLAVSPVSVPRGRLHSSPPTELSVLRGESPSVRGTPARFARQGPAPEGRREGPRADKVDKADWPAGVRMAPRVSVKGRLCSEGSQQAPRAGALPLRSLKQSGNRAPDLHGGGGYTGTSEEASPSLPRTSWKERKVIRQQGEHPPGPALAPPTTSQQEPQGSW